jgi:predicted chitinase
MARRQAGGLIDSKNIKLGGTAAPLGSAMTAESLAEFMGSKDVAYYEDWVKPLQDAMAEFGITTPQRIAAFLGQVRAESGGMKALREQIIFNDDVNVSIKTILEKGPQTAIY